MTKDRILNNRKTNNIWVIFLFFKGVTINYDTNIGIINDKYKNQNVKWEAMKNSQLNLHI